MITGSKKKTNRVSSTYNTSGCVYTASFDKNYENLIIAIYNRAIYDVYESRHVNHKHFKWRDVMRYGDDALRFLQDNPYDMGIDYETILAHMENHDFMGKENYKKNDCWNV